MAWIEAQDIVVMETVGLVDMEFMITRGDRSIITRAFVVTRSLSATEGEMSAIYELVVIEQSLFLIIAQYALDDIG